MALEAPVKGYGAGVMLQLFKSDGPNRRANFSRSKKRTGENAVSAAVWTNFKGQVRPDVEHFPAEQDRGQLRIVRTGSMLTYLVADGDEEFREVRQLEFGSEPLTSVELLADTGGCERPITVRLTQLSIRADELPFGLPAPQRTFVWGTWAMLGLAGLVALVGSGLWYWRR